MMALWQFTSFTVLIGALLVCAGVIIRRLGLANARLKRIEEELLVQIRPTDCGDSRRDEVKPEVPGEESHRGSDKEGRGAFGKESRGGYLTIRDLRGGRERLSSRATLFSNRSPVLVSEIDDELKATRGPTSSPEAAPEPEVAAAVSPQSIEVVNSCGEQVALYASPLLSENSAAVSLECDGPVETCSGPLSVSGVDPTSDPPGATGSEESDAEPAAKKDQDALLILNSQRRRRRARRGY